MGLNLSESVLTKNLKNRILSYDLASLGIVDRCGPTRHGTKLSNSDLNMPNGLELLLLFNYLNYLNYFSHTTRFWTAVGDPCSRS